MKGDITSRPTVIVEIPRATNGRIVGMSGSFKDREWPISRTPFLFGRIETSDVNLENEVGTSRRHAEIHSEGPYYTIVDLSSNGTMVNGVRIAKGAVHPLRHSDTITICASTFRFVQGAVSEPQSASAEPDDAPETTGVFDFGAIVGMGNQNVGRSADNFNIGKASDEIPALVALDALAHVARVEEEAARLRVDAEAELARARADAESARQESRRIRASIEDQDESRATLETELARMREKIEAEVRARAEAEAQARIQAEAQARAQAQVAAEVELRTQLEYQRQELERLRAESRRFSLPAAESATDMGAPAVQAAAPALTQNPTEDPSSQNREEPVSSPKPIRALTTTPENAAYHFNLNDRVILVLSADNLRGETLCTPAQLMNISQDGRLTLSCVDSVAPFWLNKTVMVGKDPDKGSLLTAETRILSTSEDLSNTVILSNTVGRLKSVQLRSSVRQLAIPELQTFSREDGKPAELVDYSIGGVAISVDKSEPHARGDVILGTLRLKRTLVFDVTLEVRGRHPSPQHDDRDILNCRFSTREMDPDVLRAISQAVLYRR